MRSNFPQEELPVGYLSFLLDRPICALISQANQSPSLNFRRPISARHQLGWPLQRKAALPALHREHAIIHKPV
jgi:hypothetical protein